MHALQGLRAVLNIFRPVLRGYAHPYLRGTTIDSKGRFPKQSESLTLD